MTPVDPAPEPTARPYRTEVPLRWSDMDAYGHVNNVQYLRLLEDARVIGFREWFGADKSLLDAGVVVSRHEIEYLAPLTYRPEPIEVDMWVTRTSGAGFTLGYVVRDPESLGRARVCARRDRARPLRLPDLPAASPHRGGALESSRSTSVDRSPSGGPAGERCRSRPDSSSPTTTRCSTSDGMPPAPVRSTPTVPCGSRPSARSSPRGSGCFRARACSAPARPSGCGPRRWPSPPSSTSSSRWRR